MNFNGRTSFMQRNSLSSMLTDKLWREVPRVLLATVLFFSNRKLQPDCPRVGSTIDSHRPILRENVSGGAGIRYRDPID